MNILVLKSDRNKALKSGDKERKEVLSTLISACQNATITPKGRVELTEDLVKEVIVKQAKIVREQIETCPASRPEKIEAFKRQLAIIEEYTPLMITDPDIIRRMIKAVCLNEQIPFDQKARKIVMPKLKKADVDMSIANKVFTDMLKEQ